MIAQKGVTTFGLQFKPILSSEMLSTGPETQKEGAISFTIEPNQGYSFGMVIRRGITDKFSFETGINYTKRNFNLSIINDTLSFNGESKFSYVIYEIPVLALLYAQLGKNLYLNTAFGASLNFLPSNWESNDTYFTHFSIQSSWIIPSLLANVGLEYRTQKDGLFYLGFSYHRPFQYLTKAGVGYTEELDRKEAAFFDISGNYLTIDLRYFFHEDPLWKQKRERE
jgi:hypothetical protein